tara:strand:- start:597 stop:1169 length:573 start_codon:yes stop_codon:yes gene_type:complete
MGMREFYWQWIKRAWRGKILWAECISGLLTLFAIPVAAYWNPEGGLLNWVPLFLFGAVFAGTLAFGFITAPYWITKEASDERDELIAARDGAMSALWELRAEGVGLRNENITGASDFEGWNARFNEWYRRTLAEAESVSQSFKNMLEPLNHIRPLPHDIVFRGFYSEEHRLHVSIINEMLERMEDRMKGA